MQTFFFALVIDDERNLVSSMRKRVQNLSFQHSTYSTAPNN